jgi:hypothetical protein
VRRIVVLSLFSLLGCSDGPADRVWHRVSRGVIRSATTVEAYLIDVPERAPGKTVEHDWWKWPMKAGPVALDAATAKRLVDVFLDDASYYTGPPKACLPQPGVKYRFVRGTEVVTVLVCYECQQLMVQDPGGGGGSGDFDPAGPALVAIVKQLFPKDPGIQRLK